MCYKEQLCFLLALHINRTDCATQCVTAASAQVKRKSFPLIRADTRGNLTIHLPVHLLSVSGPGMCLFRTLKLIWRWLSKGRRLNIWQHIISKTTRSGCPFCLTLDNLLEDGLVHLQAASIINSINQFAFLTKQQRDFVH